MKGLNFTFGKYNGNEIEYLLKVIDTERDIDENFPSISKLEKCFVIYLGANMLLH